MRALQLLTIDAWARIIQPHPDFIAADGRIPGYRAREGHRPMPKSRRSSILRQPTAALRDPLQIGLRAFHANRFGDAIVAWSPLAVRDAEVRAALAEAHFR